MHISSILAVIEVVLSFLIKILHSRCDGANLFPQTIEIIRSLVRRDNGHKRSWVEYFGKIRKGPKMMVQ